MAKKSLSSHLLAGWRAVMRLHLSRLEVPAGVLPLFLLMSSWFLLSCIRHCLISVDIPHTLSTVATNWLLN